MMSHVLEWTAAAFILVASAGIAVWIAGAIYYDVCGRAAWGRWASWVWIAFVVLVFVFWTPVWQPFLALLGGLALFLVWWLSQKPSHHRDWQPTTAILPRAFREGNAVKIENVRNFDYRSLDDFTVRYETRTYALSNLRGVDAIFFIWESGWIGHPVLVFDFGPDGRICMSIEVRFLKGEDFSSISSLYRQHELMFLAANERDVILRRTKHSENTKAYLYKLSVSEEELRDVFLDYVDAINSIYDQPRWYNLIAANCTTSFYRLPSTRFRVDWRVVANGRLDRALYRDGRIERTAPFAELRRRAYLNEVANAAPEEGFSDYIRRELERRRDER